MVPCDLQATAADARGVYGLWTGVDAILPADQMMVDWRKKKTLINVWKVKNMKYSKPIPFPNV
jgi:hypothetical protein